MVEAAARRGGRLYFASSLFSQAAALIRYVILARLLGPEQLGIAATLVVTASFFDLISDTGSDRFLIQDRDGDLPAVQKLVHSVYILRGVFIGLSLLLIAVPAAWFYKTPQLAVALAFLGLSPFIAGFQHLDFRRQQGDHNFSSEAICTIAAEFVSLISTAAAALLTHSFSSVIFGLTARSLMLVLMSRILAQRRYQLGWDPKHARRLSNFALPLMLNGVMIFVVSQGDRVIIAKGLGVKVLGSYSAAMLLIYYPTVLLARYIHAIYIPLISGKRDDLRGQIAVVDRLGGETAVMAVCMVIGFSVVSPFAVSYLFGPRFSEASLTLTLIGALQSVRFFLNWPSTVSLAVGKSGTVLASNTAHIGALAASIAGYELTRTLTGLLVGFSLGEILCGGVAVALMNLNLSQPFSSGFQRLGLLGSASILMGLWRVPYLVQNTYGASSLAVTSAAFAFWLYKSEKSSLLSLATLLPRTLGVGRLFGRPPHRLL